MVITATELKTNAGHYLDAASQDEVFITKTGNVSVIVRSSCI
jgi:prevent-host-death family protein